MTEEKTPSWLLALGQLLPDLWDTDNALTVSLAYDLSCNHTIVQGLRELLHGYQIIKEEMNKEWLTTIRAQAVTNAIKSIGTDLDQLSNSSFWRTQKKLVQKLCEVQCIGEAENTAKRIRYSLEQIITKLSESQVFLSQGKALSPACPWRSANKPTAIIWSSQKRPQGKENLKQP
jgi:hypothetical protein